MTPKRVFGGLMVMIGATLLLIVFIFTVVQNKFDESLHTVAVKKAEIEVADREYSQLLVIENQLNEFDVDLDPFLPNSKSQSEALDLVFDIFKQANVQIDGYNFTPTDGLPGATSQSQPSVAGNVLSLPLQLSPSDDSISYPDLMKLLVGLEQSQRQLNINRLTITSQPVNSEQSFGPRNTDLTIDLTVQYLKEGGNSAE